MAATAKEDDLICGHYNRNDLITIILSALRAGGKDIEALTAEDLSPIDQFHTGGKDATLRLAGRAGVNADTEVLDVGGGLGGAARLLARDFHCPVVVLDLSHEYCRAGEILTGRTGLDGLVRFRRGNALDLPFPPESFDLVWTQHSSMNVSDKERLYSEIRRVLRPGGRLALHEVMAGAIGPIHFPVPWARSAAISHLRPQAEIASLLTTLGFQKIIWNDETEIATLAPTQTGVGLHLLFEGDFDEMFQNYIRNLRENRTAVFQGVFEL